MPEMMEFTIEVDGTTYADLDFKTSQAVSSFMTGAPEGYTAEVVNIGQAVKVDDVPAGWTRRAARSSRSHCPTVRVGGKSSPRRPDGVPCGHERNHS